MSDLEYFINAYSPHYGSLTGEIIESLIKHEEKVALLNNFIDKEKLTEISSQGYKEELCGFEIWHVPKLCSPRLIDGLMSHYFLDRASLVAPLLLPLRPGMKVLDMCAAPGGKLLVMLSRLIPDLDFYVNDLSRARMHRLRNVLNLYIPQILINKIRIHNLDANYFALNKKNYFDAILLDAPCSSEQHLLKNPKLLKDFKGLRKSLPQRQYSLLCAALLALKPQGYVMYATCSINKHENQGVIKKLLKKKSKLCALSALDAPFGLADDYGLSILPHADNAGPAFLSLIRRNE
jgi:16S rRNA C967 or C1407 C5-methylase (RsmB/RsmF family)